jgi:hypothetical protein
MKQVLVACSVAVVVLSAAAPCPARSAPSFRQLVPAAASSEGAAGSYWRTDVTIHNPTDRPARILLELIPTGHEGGLSDPRAVELSGQLDPDQTVIIEDVLATHFPGAALGAVVVIARGLEGEPLEVIVTSRTWTPAGDGQGSYGQGIPAVPWSDDGGLVEEERVLVGLEESESFRTNLGLVNPTWTLEQTFSVEIFDGIGQSLGRVAYTLAPRAHIQRNGVLAELGLSGDGYSALVRLDSWQDITPGDPSRDPAPPDWVVYGSRVDRRTNDPSYLQNQSGEHAFGISRMRVVPAAASVAGSAGSYWRSDLTVFNPSPTDAMILYVDLIPSGSGGDGGAPPSFFSVLRSHATQTIADVMGARFAGYTIGALVVRPPVELATADVRVGSRTWTPPAEGDGSLGQGIPSYPLLAGDHPVVIPGLESSAAFRTNLGLVNPSRNVEVTVLLEIFDALGTSRAVLSYTLGPWAQQQINGILAAAGLEGAGYTAVVSVASSDNLMLEPSESWEVMLLAYGSRVDRLTNDPTYLEAVPLLQRATGGGDWVDFDATEPWYLCPDEPVPDEATVVTAFDRAYHWWGAENHRTIVEQVDFPDSSEWNQIGLWLHLECPESGDCDDWDRTGSLQLVLNPDDPEEEWQHLEIMRHITPYKIEMCQFVDVTALAPVLTGRRTLQSWIDTWVGPGHSSGEGWRISYRFVFYPGEPRSPDEVVNIWGRRSITLGYLDPDRNLASQIEPVSVAIPDATTRVEARLITTGHAFGNTDNCAEFCLLNQHLIVGDVDNVVLPWRTDCEHNPHNPQSGTWGFDRNGWCPGAIVPGHTIDITDQVEPGTDAVIDFDVLTVDGHEYENTDPADHDPIEWISLQLYLYR